MITWPIGKRIYYKGRVGVVERLTVTGGLVTAWLTGGLKRSVVWQHWRIIPKKRGDDGEA